jgi:hypothetical protein
MWAIEVTDEFADWYETLGETDQEPIRAAVERLEQNGPSLGRPVVGEVAGSKIHNLKELRPASSSIRVLFVFDPRRTAILLVGGDKSEHGWKDWYAKAIEQAETLYDEYLSELRAEGLIE